MACGGKLPTWMAPHPGAGGSSLGPEPSPPATAFAPPGRRVMFEYTGRTGLTVHGGATGQRYRFSAPGARVAVDPRDRPSLAMIPVLRRV